MGWLGPHAIGKVLEIPHIPLHLTACLPNHWLIGINTSHCFKLISENKLTPIDSICFFLIPVKGEFLSSASNFEE